MAIPHHLQLLLSYFCRRVFLLCLFSLSNIIPATPHRIIAMICCRKNHATPPSIAKNIPKIPMACLCPAKSVTTSYLTALIILSDVLSVNRNGRCHYSTTIVRFLIIQMDYTHDILNSFAVSDVDVVRPHNCMQF